MAHAPHDTLTAAELEEADTIMQAAKAVAIRRAPYFGSVLSSMVRVRTDGLGTMAVDKRWRVYYDPETVLKKGTEWTVTGWLHEVVAHAIMNDHERWDALSENPAYHRLWNVAGDALGNERIAGMTHTEKANNGVYIFDENDVRISKLPPEAGVSLDMSMEEAFAALKLLTPPCPSCGTPQLKEQQGQNSQESKNESNGGQSGGNLQPQGQNTAGCGHGVFGKLINLPDCGSGAGGATRPWEKSQDDASDGSVSEAHATLLKAEAADAIRKHVKSNGRGSVPAGLTRWADDLLNPVVNWRKELRALMSMLLAPKAGRRDFSYSRPSRRQIRGVVLPAMVAAAPPSAAVVMDTSGSMSDQEIGQGLAEIGALMKQIASGGSSRPVSVIMCDAAAANAQNVRNVSNLEIIGGGGTDMRVGIEKAAATKPKFDIIITFTDGDTPWPDAPPGGNRSAKYIAVLTEPGRDKYVPNWMHKIVIGDRAGVDNGG
jgi:predicted metal-dependent peptidase